MAMIGMVGTLLSGVFGAIGAIAQANAQSNMASYQAQVAQQQAQIAEQNRRYELARGETQAQKQGLEARAQAGGILATQGASGLDTESGSASLVRESAFRLGTYNEALVRSDAARRAYDFQVQGWNDQAQSQLYSMQASSAKTAGMFGAMGSLLGTAGSVAGKWYQYGGAPNVMGA